MENIILKAQEISDSIKMIARRIVDNHASMENLALVGIRRGGEFVAVRLQKAIAEFHASSPPIGLVDITLYRDDWTRISRTPIVGKTELPFSITDVTVILVDDVLFTGRTVRAAMDALIDYGRPRKIELAVLVDRGVHFRELPIMANYTGGIWETGLDETINVYLEEEGFDDYVAIEKKTMEEALPG